MRLPFQAGRGLTAIYFGAAEIVRRLFGWGWGCLWVGPNVRVCPECPHFHSEPGLSPPAPYKTAAPLSLPYGEQKLQETSEWGADFGGSLGGGVQREPEQAQCPSLALWPACWVSLGYSLPISAPHQNSHLSLEARPWHPWKQDEGLQG